MMNNVLLWRTTKLFYGIVFSNTANNKNHDYIVIERSIICLLFICYYILRLFENQTIPLKFDCIASFFFLSAVF